MKKFLILSISVASILALTTSASNTKQNPVKNYSIALHDTLPPTDTGRGANRDRNQMKTDTAGKMNKMKRQTNKTDSSSGTLPPPQN